MAEVIKQFKGVRDGTHRVVVFNPGDTVDGDLAAVAVREGWAVEPGKSGAAGEYSPSQPAGRRSSKKTSRKRQVKRSRSTARGR